MTVTTEISNFINGKQVSAANGETTELIDPSTGEVFATAPLSGLEDVDAALRTAAEAFESWRDTTPSERQRALLRIADAIEERADELVAVDRTGRRPEPDDRHHADLDRRAGRSRIGRCLAG